MTLSNKFTQNATLRFILLFITNSIISNVSFKLWPYAASILKVKSEYKKKLCLISKLKYYITLI